MHILHCTLNCALIVKCTLCIVTLDSPVACTVDSTVTALQCYLYSIFTHYRVNSAVNYTKLYI